MVAAFCGPAPADDDRRRACGDDDGGRAEELGAIFGSLETLGKSAWISLEKVWILLDSLVRIEPFQWVMRTPASFFRHR